MANTRKSFSGAAVPTTLTSGITSTDTIIAVAATINYPDTAVGPFVVTIDRGQGSLEEKVLIASYTATTMTIAANGRGYDGTTAQSHSNGAILAHTLDAATLTEHDAFVVGVGSVEPHASAVGDTATSGTSTYASRADHRHGREPWAVGATSTSEPGDTENDGTSVSPARADHRHAREAVPVPQVPVGGIIEWASTTAPENFLFMHGQTVTGGATTYPTLAAVYPAWVSGANLVVPDSRTRFTLGAGTKAPGTTGGASSTTLTTAMLPTTAVSITDPGHVHALTDPGHVHSGKTGYEFMEGSVPTSTLYVNAGSNVDHGNNTNVSYVTSTASAETGISIGSHTTGITAKFGNAAPTAVTHTPPYLALHKIVRAA